jgi:hypothetical protein
MEELKDKYYSYTYLGHSYTYLGHSYTYLGLHFTDIIPQPIFYIGPRLYDKNHPKYSSIGTIVKGTNIHNLGMGLQKAFNGHLVTNLNQINDSFRVLSGEHLLLYKFHDYYYPTFIREFLESISKL